MALGLALLTLAVYLPAGWNDFVNYDDPDYITSNQWVQRGLTTESIAWAFRTGHASNWHPLTWVSHMVDVELFGLRPGPSHAVNVTLHIANSVLLFLLLTRLTRLPWRCWFVAALFALHPIHVESVAWAAERKDVLSTLFFLLALAAYARYAGTTTRDRWAAYCLAVALHAAALMSKAMPVTLPFVLLLLDYWPLRRLSLGATASRISVPLPKLILEKVPFLALSIAVGLVTFFVQKEGGAVGTHFSLGARAANAVVAYATYLVKTAWPANLAVLYPHPGQWPTAVVLCSASALAGISVAVWLRRRSEPYLLVGWCWYFGMLVPVIGLVQVGVQSMADRYTYAPLIGVFVAVVWLAADLASGRQQAAGILAGAGAAVLLCCAGFTVRQLGFWRDSETLFQHALAVTKNNFVAYNALGYYYGAQGRAEDELEYYRRSLEAGPEYVEALNNMGCALSARRRFSEALPFLERALQHSPRNAEVHFNLANALWELGQRDQAVQHYTRTVELRPDHAEAHDKLGMAAAVGGRLPEATAHFQSAIQSRPGFAPAYSHLGNVYTLHQRWEDAARQHAQAVRLQPGNAAFRYNLGNVLLQLGRVAEATSHLREAAKLAPDDPESVCKLGVALMRQGDREAAADCFRQALKLKPDYGEAQRQLQNLRP